MDEFNFYKFIAYLIGFAIAALLLLKLYLMYTFRKIEKEGRQQQQQQQEELLK
jgi:phosphotransferase system  glucose/maltose/N-acetylglucosamine-specific IIC component